MYTAKAKTHVYCLEILRDVFVSKLGNKKSLEEMIFFNMQYKAIRKFAQFSKIPKKVAQKIIYSCEIRSFKDG